MYKKKSMNYISILFVLFMFLYACTDENIINDASGRIPEAPEGKLILL